MKHVLSNKERLYISRKTGKSISQIYWEDLDLEPEFKNEFIAKQQLINSDYPLDYCIGVLQIPELDIVLNINPQVLIPRPETIYWLEKCIKAKWIPTNYEVFDVGAGSGVIGISLAKAGFKVTMSDISVSALETAKTNISFNQVDHQMIAVLADGIEHIYNNSHLNKESIPWVLISNPPYVPEDDKFQDSYESIKYEPELAIFSGKDGLEMTRKLASYLKKLKNLPELIILELDPRNIHQALILFDFMPFSALIKDESGFERVLVAGLDGQIITKIQNSL